jgi:hypothetical protein
MGTVVTVSNNLPASAPRTRPGSTITSISGVPPPSSSTLNLRFRHQ